MGQWQSHQAAVTAALNEPLPVVGTVVDDSVFDLLQTRSGRVVEKDHKLDGNGAQNDNVFQITGMVEVLEILLHAHTVTDATTVTNLKFELWDGLAAIDITNVIDTSGILVDGMVYKRGLKALAAVLVNSDVGTIAEAAANKVSFEPFFLVKKTGADTFIRIAFTGDVATDVDVHIEVRYRPHTHDGLIVVV